MLPRAWVRGLCLAPLVLQLFSVQVAHAAAPGAGAAARAGAFSAFPQSNQGPTPTPPPDQSKPGPTPDASSPTTSGPTTPPSAATSQHPYTTNALSLRREVFGYATAGSLGDPTIGYPSWNFDLLSTVAFFSIHVQYDGQLVGDSDFAVWDSSTFTNFLNTAHSHGSKVVVTITGPSNPVDLCDALYNDTQTISQLMNQVKAKGVDGVNIDYEGQIGPCQNVINPSLNTTNQALMIKLAKDMRAALDAIKPGYYLSIASYSGSASANDGFFNIPALNQYVDSFFVMAYDMDEANQPYPPLNCSSFCFAPVSPLTGYYWNDTTSMTQYSSVVGPGKVILGQPYYGRVGCVSSPADHATLTSNFGAATYVGAAGVVASPDVEPGTFAIHRDDLDPNGQDRWDSWYDNSLHCWRVMHWSDTNTLGVRYNLVNQMNLRGVGLWTLNYGGGSPELWTALHTYFLNCYSLDASAQPGPPQFTGTVVTVTATGGCPDPNPLYEFWVLPPGASAYQIAQSYSPSNTLTWKTSGLAAGSYHFSVWVRDASSTGAYGNQFGTWDTYNNNLVYLLNSNLCFGVSTSFAPGAATAVGGAVTIKAQATNCPSPQYEFWFLAPGAGAFTQAQAYSTSNTFTWSTAGLVPGPYRIVVWARDANSAGAFSNSTGAWDAASNDGYALTSCSSAGVTFAPSNATAVGTPVTVTAAASGCASPQFQFWVLAPGATAFVQAQAYSSSPTLTWSTAGQAPGNYLFSVWVKDLNSGGASGNPFGRWDTYGLGQHTVTSCSSVSAGASPGSAPVGKAVTLSAAASGCSSPQYQFWILAPGATAYVAAQAYSSSGTLNWSATGVAPGVYQVSVWVKDANSSGGFGNQFGRWDAYTSTQFTITSCSALSVGASPAGSTSAGKTVTFTATATGCANPQYQFWILAPGATAYQVAQAYSSSNTLTWATTGLPPGTYQVSVWVKDANSSGGSGNSFGRWDAYAASQYVLS